MRTSAREHEHESNKRLSIPITVRQVRLRVVIVTSRDVVMTSRDDVMTTCVFQSIYFRKNFHF